MRASFSPSGVGVIAITTARGATEVQHRAGGRGRPECDCIAAARGHNHWWRTLVAVLRRRRTDGYGCRRRSHLSRAGHSFDSGSACSVRGVCTLGRGRHCGSASAQARVIHYRVDLFASWFCCSSRAYIRATAVGAVFSLEFGRLYRLRRGTFGRPDTNVGNALGSQSRPQYP